MGKMARFACIFTPAILSIASTLILLVILLGGMNKKNQSLSQLYEYRVDFTDFKAKVAANVYMKPANSLIDNLLFALRTSAQNNNLKDFYQVYPWNYCSGTGDKIDYCSKGEAGYFFNPVVEWSLNATLSDRYTSSKVAEPMNIFKNSIKWLFAAYMIAFFANLATVIVGAFAVCSRIVSIFATIFSLVCFRKNLFRSSKVA
jgi:hypothetical protein